MKNSPFDLYFFYKNRKKIRYSFFLDAFPQFVQDFILKKYTVKQYKTIDKLIIVSKLIIISLLYLILYKVTDITDEVALVLPYAPLVFIAFLCVLTLFEYNKRGLIDIEHDHYFRMLGDKRNNLLKEVMIRNIRYAFMNWLIPLTIFPFIYASLVGSIKYILLYSIFTAIFYLVTCSFIFLTQRILFDYLKDMVVVDNLLVFFCLGLVFVISIGLTLLPTNVLTFIANHTVELVLNIAIYLLIIIGLYITKERIIKSTVNYSISNIIIQGKKSRVRTNQIEKPNMILSLLMGKNTFQNTLLKKDLLSYYRKDKKELFTMIIWGFMSIIYAGFITSTLIDDALVQETMLVDNLFIVMVSVFYISILYRMKDITWYSAEGSNLMMFSKFGYDKYTILKEKLRLNYVILSPLIIVYMIAPIFLTFSMNETSILYSLLRIPVLYLYFTNIVEYSLIQDTENPRKNRYDNVSGIGAINLIVLIVMLQGVGLTFLLIYMSNENTWLSNINHIEFALYCLLLVIMLLFRIWFILKKRKFKGIYEGEKIYG